MRKIILYSAMSLNGKIARLDGQVDWLDDVPHKEGEDYGYYAFYDSIDTTIQGYNTFDLLMSWDIDWPYPEKKNYVVTRKQDLENTEHVEFISQNHLDFIQKLKEEEGGDIWLIGGGQLNTMMLNAGLIDEMILHVMPIVIPEGIALFEGSPDQNQFKLASSGSFDSGVVELRYKLQ